jgi:hypothetical protein
VDFTIVCPFRFVTLTDTFFWLPPSADTRVIQQYARLRTAPVVFFGEKHAVLKITFGWYVEWVTFVGLLLFPKGSDGDSGTRYVML